MSDKKGMVMTFKVKVKNGDSTYRWDEKKSQYGYADADLVDEHDTLAEALQGFLEWVVDPDLDTKVSLTCTPEDGKKGKKKNRK